ncbi:outer membrane protein assembly factor BamB [Halovibrio salipaludis]|uniref:Outer membrane protein assembly factor BamB n=1 Tax=Halovibrio salipaludis TaxID=2032626 RepID=A0A2A2F8A3_9GAMM|nr:outer membrane protein assembly factor BamB [Halovibrio salipaludis]PAU80917.1 outer membrane protein assembly factor BamB [Halovibrio salipaludis]
MRAPAAAWRCLMTFILAGVVLAGCSSSEPREQPAPVPGVSGDAEIREIWSRRVGEGMDGQYLFLSPGIHEETVYAATQNGYITAYNARNGRRDWWEKLDERLLGGVGVDADHLYVVTRNGELIALSHEGKEQWRTSLPNEALVPPQSNGRYVVVQTIDGELLAFSQSNGNRRWQYDSNMPVLSFRGNATPWIDGSRVIAGFDNGRVVALDVRSGAVQWEQRLAQPAGRTELERLVDVDSSPHVVDDTVYVSAYQGSVTALELRSGEERWSRELSSLEAPAVTQEQVVAAGADGTLVGFERASRSELWRHRELAWRQPTAPVALGNHAVVGDFEGYLYAVDAADGTIDSRVLVDDEGLRTDPIRFRDRVIVFGNGGWLASYHVREGDR